MTDLAIRQRAGKNTSPGPVLFVNGHKGSGAIVKILAGVDNVLLQGLESAVRIAGAVQTSAASIGCLLNRSGSAVDGDIVYIDARGREIVLATSISIANNNTDEDNIVPIPNPSFGYFGFLAGEKVVFRRTGGGDPSAGNGVYFIPEGIFDARNVISERIIVPALNRRVVIAAPPPGKTWQTPAALSYYPCGASTLVANYAAAFDFGCNTFLVAENGDELLVDNATDCFRGAFTNILADLLTFHQFPHPYRLEVELLDEDPPHGYTPGDLVVATLWAEFDLPKDLGNL